MSVRFNAWPGSSLKRFAREAFESLSVRSPRGVDGAIVAFAADFGSVSVGFCVAVGKWDGDS